MVLSTRDSIWLGLLRTERKPSGGRVPGVRPPEIPLPRGVWPRALPAASVPTLKSCRRHSAPCRSREINHDFIALSELPACSSHSGLRQGRPAGPCAISCLVPFSLQKLALSFLPSLSPSFFPSVFLPLPFPSNPIDPEILRALRILPPQNYFFPQENKAGHVKERF